MLSSCSGPDFPVHPPLCTPLDKYANHLRSCYLKPFTSTRWPYLNGRKYINLAVVSFVCAGREEQLMFRQQRVLGSIEDILDPIAMKDILKPNCVYDDKQTKCLVTQLLIEGAPGTGKSTFAWEVCQKWGQYQLFKEYSLVVLVSFQDKQMKEAKSISDLFYHPNADLQSEIVKVITETDGHGLLLILEGFDEAPASKRTMDSIFVRLFRGQELPRATVVLTTRPSASAELCQLCNYSVNSRRIEVVGFGKKEIDEYIHYAFSDELSRSDFKEYLSLYPCIRGMMYVPLNSAIVTETYSSCKSSGIVVPKTMTQLYSSLIRTLLLCYLKDEEEYKNANINTFKDLTQPMYDQFCEICKLAYTGIVSAETKLIFNSQDLRSDFNPLGLMQTYSELRIDRGTSLSYNFLHLTLQEYLAAYHISQQSRYEQVAFMREHIGSAKLQVVSRFLAGLSELGSELWDVVRGFASNYKLHNSLLQEETIRIQILHWLFESRDPSAITAVLGSDCVCFCHSCVNTLPLDWYVLGYCITHSSCDWKLELQHCQLESAELFLRALNYPPQGQCLLPWKIKGLWFRWSTPAAVKFLVPNSVFYNLTHLCLMSSSLTSETCNDLCKPTGLLKHLEYLNLTDNPIDRGGAVNLIKFLTEFSTIRELNLYCTCIGFEDCKALNELLASSKNIEVLNIGANALSHDSIQLIVDGLSQNTSLEKLLLQSSIFSSENVLSLTSVLNVNTKLKNLDIRYCSILNSDFDCLVKALNENTATQLQTLKLSGNPICSKGTEAFASMLATNKSLVELYISECSIQGEGAVCLAHALKVNSTVSYLDVSDNPIGSEGAAAFAKLLVTNKSLATLDMRHCSIQDEGAVHLARAMEKNCAVMALYVSGNPIGSEGAAAFAGVLVRNQCMKILWLDDAIMSVESSLELIKSLRQNATLEKLWLSDKYKPPSFFTLDKTLQDRVNFI